MDKGSFIDFIVECSKDPVLTKEFLKILSKDNLTQKELGVFLEKHCKISPDELKKIFEARNNICSIFNGQLKY